MKKYMQQQSQSNISMKGGAIRRILCKTQLKHGNAEKIQKLVKISKRAKSIC